MDSALEKELNEKAERIYTLQREIDQLLSEIWEADETYGSEVSEVLREELYRD